MMLCKIANSYSVLVFIFQEMSISQTRNLRRVYFCLATFTERADFSSATFTKEAHLSHSNFIDEVKFDNSKFPSPKTERF